MLSLKHGSFSHTRILRLLCNAKCGLKISVDIPVDYGFALMIHYKQGTPKAKGNTA